MFNSDLASRFEDKSKHPDTPSGLRAPERIFNCALDQTIDIWSFGCLVYELLTGRELFPLMTGEGDDIHIFMIIDQLGLYLSDSSPNWIDLTGTSDQMVNMSTR